MSLDDVDLAAVSDCPGCGIPVRRFASVPIRGNGLDGEPSSAWHCPKCLQRKTAEAAQGLHA